MLCLVGPCFPQSTQTYYFNHPQTQRTHGAVSRVHYPGLTSHPDHHLARAQQTGFGAIISFELNGGEAEVRAFLNRSSLFTLAESLGGVESLVCHPASMTHAAMTEEAQLEAGIKNTLLRLSVGIEHTPDLISDISTALASASRAGLGVVSFA